MVRRRGNPFADRVKRLAHKALLRRDNPFVLRLKTRSRRYSSALRAALNISPTQAVAEMSLAAESSVSTQRRRPVQCRRGSMRRVSRAVLLQCRRAILK
jgi:hypothetical protein